MDDVGGIVKNAILQNVKLDSGPYTQRLFDAAIKFVPSINIAYLPKSDKIVEPESIHQAPFFLETHSIRKFVQQINDRRLQYRIFQDGCRPGSISHSIVQKS